MTVPDRSVSEETMLSRQGYLGFLAAALILVGILHVFLSVIMLFGTVATGGAWLAAFFQALQHEEWSRVGFVELVGIYISVMNWTGWLAGAFSIYAGRQVLAGRGRRLAIAAAIVNLIYFPMGLTTGILALIGLHRTELRQAFAEHPHGLSA